MASEMPERIWAWGNNKIAWWHDKPEYGATEYIRADLVDDLRKALEGARESIETLANMVSDSRQFRQDVSDDLAAIDAALARIDALKEK